MQKICSKCLNAKPESEFYKDSKNSDGLKSTCSDCLRKIARDYSRLDEVKLRKRTLYEKRDKAKYNSNAMSKYRAVRDLPEFKIRRAARNAVAYAIRTGKIIRLPCQICGSKDAQAHHADYSQKLNVTWLCKEHHGKTHRTFA